VSVIYLVRRLPCASSILPSIVFQRTRTDRPQPMVYADLQPPDRTALRSPAGWWSLTPPSHPYPALYGSEAVVFFFRILLSPTAGIFTSGVSYAARTFLSHASPVGGNCTSDRPWRCFYMFCFSRFSDH